MDSKKNKSEQPDADKLLVSFYLSGATYEKIEDLLFYLKKRVPVGKRRKLNKSFFFEAGFKVLLNEYEKKGEKSLLWKAIHQSMET